MDTQPITGHVDTQTGCDDTKPGHLGADAEPNYDAVNTQLSHIGTDTQPVLDDTESGHVDAGLQPDYDVNTLFGHGDADIQPGCDDTKPGHILNPFKRNPVILVLILNPTMLFTLMRISNLVVLMISRLVMLMVILMTSIIRHVFMYVL